MALIECADCGRQFSSHAQACPHCGRPRGGQSIFTKELGADGLVCGAMIVAGLVMLIYMGMAVGLLVAGVGLVLLFVVLLKK